MSTPKLWKCLGCKKEVDALTNDNYQLRCDCQDKNYVCKPCYKAKPDNNHWQSIFGSHHALRDVDKGSLMMQWLAQNMGNFAMTGAANPTNKPTIGKKIGDNVTVLTPDQFAGLFGAAPAPKNTEAPKPK